MISIGFLLFLIIIFNLFSCLLLQILMDGNDFNLLLQDVGLIVYLLMFYMGYVGFLVVFVFVIVVLFGGCLDVVWVCWLWFWILVVWVFFGIGIVFGFWWVYYELGWGGWWFWDLVENVFFMFWLVGIVLIYLLVVIEKCGVFKSWIVLLVIVVFFLSLLGIFLVCFGVFILVYVFVFDLECGVFIFVFLLLVVGGLLILFVLCVLVVKSQVGFVLWLCEILLLLNNLVLVVVVSMIFFGIFYLLLFDVFSGVKLLVGLLYFNVMFLLLMVVLMVVLVVGVLVCWKDILSCWLFGMLILVLVVSVVLVVVGLMYFGDFNWVVLVVFLLFVWVVLVGFCDFFDKIWYKGVLVGVCSLICSYWGM